MTEHNMPREWEFSVTDAEQSQTAATRLAAHLQAGDLVILTGGLGAGKTTFTQGLAAGLGVRGPVTSPTFVIARVYPSLGLGPDLVHADAYRLGSWEELDALDLDTSLDTAITAVEWGKGKVEALAENRLEITITRPADPADMPSGPPLEQIDLTAVDNGRRQFHLRGFGPRWTDTLWSELKTIWPTAALSNPLTSHQGGKSNGKLAASENTETA